MENGYTNKWLGNIEQFSIQQEKKVWHYEQINYTWIDNFTEELQVYMHTKWVKEN